MNFGFEIFAVVGLVSAIVTSLCLPLWRKIFLKRGWVDAPGERKQQAAPVVLAGGMAVLTGLFVGMLLSAALTNFAPTRQTIVLLPTDAVVWRWLLGVTAIGLLGWCDDVIELKPATKFLGQLVIVVATIAAGARLPILPEMPWAERMAGGIFLLMIVNAFNFLDNMNGLCAGLGVIAAVSLAAILSRYDRNAVALAVTLAGSCAGFLPRNYPQATVFLGDAGSHLIGYLVGVLAMTACEARALDGLEVRAFLPLIVLAVPVFDIVQVVIGRLRRRRPIYLGDTHHISHQLQRRGWSAAAAVGILWGMAAVAGATGAALSLLLAAR